MTLPGEIGLPAPAKVAACLHNDRSIVAVAALYELGADLPFGNIRNATVENLGVTLDHVQVFSRNLGQIDMKYRQVRSKNRFRTLLNAHLPTHFPPGLCDRPEEIPTIFKRALRVDKDCHMPGGVRFHSFGIAGRSGSCASAEKEKPEPVIWNVKPTTLFSIA